MAYTRVGDFLVGLIGLALLRSRVADLGDKRCLSISLWETRDQAQAATPVAASWVKDNVADRVKLTSNSVGDFAFFQGVPATV